ncbi:MAG: 3-dehydroquinate synthase [Bacteroidales bacterium]|jgi:3-dehydroquinate synthase|nr:3-dehydroquinate synthase [Bacteroidales bacterium]
MYALKICTDGAESRVLLGESFHHLGAYLPKNKQVIIITDGNVRKHYRELTDGFPVVEIGVGEQHKTVGTVENIYAALLDLNADRNSFIVAVGGGLVCDVAGFAASTYMRGIPFGFVSTTLLSQVDASVGGKNGVNFGGYKNMVGTFNQPQFVICDHDMLNTLPDAEFVSGLAEIVKAAAIRDAALFDYLEKHADEVLERKPDVLSHIITASVKIKAQVVENDEREQGERRILNFGHTFGHAVEVLSGVSHGEAVSVGMMIAARWSAGECGFPLGGVQRLEQLLQRLGLPVISAVPVDDVLQSAAKDKKKESGFIHLVLLNDIGKTEIRKTAVDEINRKLGNYYHATQV